ncbi:MAG: ABC transporter substrate-binding protein, partial [Acidocella sp.]|uniref:ABC transporter substrate-binding protein n=1 Tax=Acidocella sp. TaxID=50710 RepID=UPI003FD76467
MLRRSCPRRRTLSWAPGRTARRPLCSTSSASRMPMPSLITAICMEAGSPAVSTGSARLIASTVAMTLAFGWRWMLSMALPHPAQSIETARQLLKSAGYSWNSAGQLRDSTGQLVEFSIITSSSNGQRMKMATLLQDDLSHLGMQVHVVPLEFRAMIDRVFQSFDYDAAIMGLGGGDADPNPEMNVWTFNGTSHLWHMGETQPATGWERELDQLMQQQMITLDYA